MTNTNTCSEQEATIIAGVSSKTLKRFHESGYLHVTPDSNGSPLYSRDEILEIFGPSPLVDDTESALDASSSTSYAGRCEKSLSVATEPVATETVATETVATETGMTGSLEDRVGTFASHLPSSDCAANRGDEPVQSTCEAPIFSDESTSTAPKSRTAESGERLVSINELERLQNLISIQEKMLDSKEDEIADLKNQRSWLRERIERLEEKGERDQILLLSETQTLRSLIAYHENKRSPVRQLLEWIGLSKSEEPDPSIGAPTTHSKTGSHRTIEVDKVAND